MNDENSQADTRRILIVNLSGDQKDALGFATWTQITISAIGLAVGIILYTLVSKLMGFMGFQTGVAILSAFIVGGIATAPFIWLAFDPVKDQDGHVLYYKNKQLQIDYFYRKNEIGTYLNIQRKIHPVNANLPYRPKNR